MTINDLAKEFGVQPYTIAEFYPDLGQTPHNEELPEETVNLIRDAWNYMG